MVRRRSRRLPSGRIVSVLLAVALGACHAPEPTSLLLVTVDTLRADRLGCYGDGAAATPAIDRLAATGTLFTNAACPMPVTRPSHFSLFTSRSPRSHGVVDNSLALPQEALTLAEVLTAEGYRTAAFVGVTILGERSGAEQGFATFEGPASGGRAGRRERPADEVVDSALAWLDGAAGGEAPFFLWLHLFDPHMPYAPPAVFAPAVDAELPTASWPILGDLAEAQGGGLRADQLERIRALYAGEVAAVDAALGRLLAALEASPAGGRTVTVFTADHGECFEHGYFFRHSSCLYDGAARVPLLIRAPGGRSGLAAGVRIEDPVELIDVAPTFLALAGIEPPAPFHGRSLLAARDPERLALLEHPRYDPRLARRLERMWSRIDSVAGEPMQQDPAEGDLYGLRSARRKYLVGTDGEELYDLVADPGETHNLAAERPRELLEMRRALRQRLDGEPRVQLEEGEVDPELLEALRALGYL